MKPVCLTLPTFSLTPFPKINSNFFIIFQSKKGKNPSCGLRVIVQYFEKHQNHRELRELKHRATKITVDAPRIRWA
jgi:hypothetical protein